MQNITDQDYKEILKSNEKVAIKIHAAWCSPCKVLAPIVEEVASEMTETSFYSCDADQNKEMLAEYGIRNIPAILFFKNGELVDKLIGNQTKAKILEKLN